MPIVATPTTPTVVSKDQVRMFMRDYANNNILLDDVQFTDVELNLAFEGVRPLAPKAASAAKVEAKKAMAGEKPAPPKKTAEASK